MRAINTLIVILAFATQLPLSQSAEANIDGVSQSRIQDRQNAREPAAAMNDDAVALTEFDHVDPKHLVPDVPLKRAIIYFKKNKAKFENRNYIGIVDFTRSSNQPRLFIVNLNTGVVHTHFTSHGKGSDPANTGHARRFSNRSGSDESSYGFYRTGEVYIGKHGRSLRLDGLSSSNSNARARAIVMHAAWYVTEKGHHSGRSDGCFALDPAKRDTVISELEGGALLYGWSGQK